MAERRDRLHVAPQSIIVCSPRCAWRHQQGSAHYWLLLLLTSRCGRLTKLTRHQTSSQSGYYWADLMQSDLDITLHLSRALCNQISFWSLVLAGSCMLQEDNRAAMTESGSEHSWSFWSLDSLEFCVLRPDFNGCPYLFKPEYTDEELLQFERQATRLRMTFGYTQPLSVLDYFELLSVYPVPCPNMGKSPNLTTST